MNIKLVRSDDLSKPTVLRFLHYQFNQWISEGVSFFIFKGSEDDILSYLKTLTASQIDCIKIYPSLSLCHIWHQILSLFQQHPSISCHFYLNSFVGIETCIEECVPLISIQDSFVVNSYFSKYSLLSILPNISVESIHVNPVSIKRTINTARTKKYITVFARPSRHKLIEYSIRAFATIDQTDYSLMIGLLADQSEEASLYRNYLHQICHKYNIKYDIKENLDVNDVSLILSHSVANICLSSTFEETQGKVIIEAASNYCLPVANRWNGFPEFFNNTKYLVDTLFSPALGVYVDVSQLANALRNSIELYRNDFEKYLYICQEIYDIYTFNIPRTLFFSIHSSTKYNRYTYEDYLYLFSHGSIVFPKFSEIDPDQIHQYSIDVYLSLRTRINSTNDNSRLFAYDYQWLLFHTDKPFSWSPLLEVISWECLTTNQWQLSLLKQIFNLVAYHNYYPVWIETMSSLIPL